MFKEWQCEKSFRFGNDAIETCRTATIAPVNFAGKTGHFCVYVLEGNTPFLFPRPLMEQFGLVVDFGAKRLRWRDSRWTEVRQRNCQGHYLLNLAEDTEHMRTHLHHPDFAYVPPGLQHEAQPGFQKHAVCEVCDYTNQEVNAQDPVCYPCLGPEENDVKELLPHALRSILYAVTDASTRTSRLLTSACKPLRKRRKCWEVYVGIGRLSQELRKLGIEVSQFGLENGWDLTDPAHQQAFLNLMDYEEPDEVWLSPMCGPWSQMQQTNATDDPSRERLKEKNASGTTRTCCVLPFECSTSK